MLKIKSIIQSLFIILIITGCGNKNTSFQKIGFMENVKVFEEFEMKKDYDKKIESDLKLEVAILDSIQLLVNKLNIQENREDLNLAKEAYYTKQKQYNQLFQELSSKYTSEVNNRLNDYIKEFSEKNKYAIILGSGGEGNVMYTKDGINITEELIEFINKKYKN